MFEKRLTLSRITCCYLNWKTSELIWVSFTCSTRTCSTDIKVSGSTNLFPFHSLLHLVCPKVVYWAHFYSFYSSTTLPMIFQTVTSICLLMISKFLPLQMSPLFRMISILYKSGVLSIASKSIPWSAKPWISVGLTKTYSWCWVLIAYHTLIKSIEDLGFIVTRNVSWKEHIIFKLLKSGRVFQFLKRNIPHVISVTKNKLLLTSLLLPILLYGTSVWSPSVVDLKRMGIFQYKAIRWIKVCPFLCFRVVASRSTPHLLLTHQRWHQHSLEALQQPKRCWL